MTDIAFLGLGIMGTGMVRNLLMAGHDLQVWNRTPRPLPGDLQAARVAGSVAEAVRGCGHVMVCVTGPEAQRAIYYGEDALLTALEAGTVVIDLTTTDPATAVELGQEVERQGCIYLDAPVFGSRQESWSGILDVVVGGPADAFQEAGPLFDAIGKSAHHMGQVGSGAAMKLVGNVMVAAQVVAAGEGLALAAKAGLDLDRVIDVVRETDFGSGVVVGTASATAAGDFAPNFHLKNMVKDARLIAGDAQRRDVAMPVAATVGQLYQAALNRGWGDENVSAVHKLILEMAGVERG